jgi:hypothetical protein
VQPIFKEIASGIIRNVSVGYRVNKFEKSAEETAYPFIVRLTGPLLSFPSCRSEQMTARNFGA